MGNQETKVHYKMYKAGKLWLYSSVALVSLAGMGMGTQVASADEKGSEPSSAVVSDDDADKATDENVVSLDADVSTEKTDASETNEVEAAKASVAAPVKESADSSKQEVAPKAETKASVTETSKQEVAPKAEAEAPVTETSKQEVAPKAETKAPATETSKQEVVPKAEAEAPATETSKQEVAPKAETKTPATETSKQEVAPKAETKAPATVEQAQASQKEAAKKQAPKADDIVTLESLTSDLKTSSEYQALTKTQQAAALSYAERQLRAAQKAGQATYANKAFAPFALIQGSVLEDVKVTNDSGTKRGGKADDGTALKADNGVSDVVIKLNGTKPADVSLIGSGKKVAGIQIPAELIGRVTPNGTAKINTSISIRLDEVPLLRAALEGLQAGVNTFDSVVATLLNEAAKAIPVEIVTKDADGNVVLGADGKPANGLQTTVDAINNLLADAITFDQADLEANMKLSDDGKMITAELNDDFADVIAKNLTDALDHIYDLIGGLTVQPIGGKYDSNPIIAAQQIAAVATANTALTAAKLPLRAAVETLKGVVTAGGAILDQFGSAAVLGDTEVDMPISIDTTGMDQSVIDANNGVVRINGMVSTDDLLALNLFNDKTDSTNIYFETSFDQLTAPKVNATTDEDGKSTITVEGEPNAEITVKDADGNVIATGTTDADGKLTLDLPEDSAGKKITVDQTVDGETSDPTEITVPTADLSKAKEDAKNKIDEMPNLTDAEKDDFKKQVDDATSKNDVNKVVDDAQAKNDAKANDPLADAKDEAKDKIDNMP
ncbi:adhesive domain-containing protein, partial [Weissella minor]|uniref:adhesive domain-containing protein n=1 Tax=Weissella minor TaxID=1620 RepID=UPI0012ECE552